MYVGIDIGGTKILAAASPTGQRLTKSLKVATPAKAKDGIEAIVKLAYEVAGSSPIASVGVAAPGPLDLSRGIMLNPPNIPWRDLELKRTLEKRLNTAVTVQHDAACAGLAETSLGVGRGYSRVVYVTISTGIGVSLIVDGQIYHALNRNIEAGHITIQQDGPECSCGGHGHFEALASGRAIKRDFGKFGYEIKDAKTWDKIGARIAAGMASLNATYAPELMILGGGVGVHYKRFYRPMMKYMADDFRYGMPEIRQAKYVETAPVIGALLLASQAEQLLL